MASDRKNLSSIIYKVTLLGASIGALAGLIEAAGLRLTDIPIIFLKPHVTSSFWFAAPLLAALAFGLLGLLAGLLAALTRSRFLGMLLIATLAGLGGAYLGLVIRFSQQHSGWFVALHDYLTPGILFAVVFGWTLPALWSTRKPDSPLGGLADVPLRPWGLAVFAAVAFLLLGMEFSGSPKRLSNPPAPDAPTSRAPNIILIVWDTTRADHLSAYGYFRKTTPHLEELAKHGTLFENAISPSPWTLPSMASVFTSLLPHQHGAGSDLPLGNGPRTLAEILQARGYETAGFNSNSLYGVTAWGLARGFETYVDSTGTFGYNLNASMVGRTIIKPISSRCFDRVRFNQYDAHHLNEQVYRWYGRRSDRPFFLFINYNDAHEPYEVPAPYDHVYGHAPKEAKYLVQTARFDLFSLPPDQREGLIAAYDNCLAYIDSQMEELLRSLSRTPDWSNTYLIVTADHGEGFGEHGTYGHGWDLYREVLHVPLIILGPGVPAGIQIPDLARTRQIFPTVLEMAGERSPILNRTSLRPLWTPGYVAPIPDEPTVSENQEIMPLPAPQGMISLTTREWHLIYQHGYHRSRLYHWPTDPLELTNLADSPEHQAIAQQLLARTFSIVEGSYRPWRDTRYLLALAGPTFSPEVEAKEPPRFDPSAGLPPIGAGAAQSLFRPNPEIPRPNGQSADKELLRSLPYTQP